MAVRTYRFSGETLAEARKNLREFILEGKYLEKETVLSDGKPITLRQTGRTTEEALALALKNVPSDAVVIDRSEIRPPRVRTMVVTAWDRAAARHAAEAAPDESSTLIALQLRAPGRRGILGIGRTPDTYEAMFRLEAIVSLVYKSPALVSLDIEERQEIRSARTGPRSGPRAPEHRRIEVCHQGSSVTNQIELDDALANGFQIVAVDDSETWTYKGDTGTVYCRMYKYSLVRY
jgi:hypothetical protein